MTETVKEKGIERQAENEIRKALIAYMLDKVDSIIKTY